MLMKDEIKIFIRDNRLYQVVQLRKKQTGEIRYAIIKIPYAKVPRFIELPRLQEKCYFMFVEDVISANLVDIFIGYTVEGSYSIKISRDADIYINEEKPATNIVETIKKEVKKRKIGDLSRFVYDRRMPLACLDYICETCSIRKEDLIPDNIHLNMEDLIKLPNPAGKELEREPLLPVRIPELDKADWIFPVIRKKDIFFHYPYHTFDYFIRFLMEASTNPRVEEIRLTQYRVAQDSEIITNLINAAKNGKRVTVFVELKARFDEENNLKTAEIMQQAGICILYSLPGLKVHAKVALVVEKPNFRKQRRSYVCLSTGNFNEKTARLYSDMAVLTSNTKLTREICQLFDVLKGQPPTIRFNHLLVTQFNMLQNLKELVQREIKHAEEGEKTHIILKMNALQDPALIDELYRASEAGVKIDLIIRGISCIIPNQPYSKNIRITRIVDIFLEHSRIWYFYNRGREDVFLSSADWMKRNLYRRIEVAFPLQDRKIKQTVIDLLKIQLNDNQKACFIDERLNNLFKRGNQPATVHAQRDIYEYLQEKEKQI
jgi:polyphosphate kinase